MARQPNAGRDIETDILRVLARASGPLTAREIREAMPLPAVSATGVRSNLYVLERRIWIREPLPIGRPVRLMKCPDWDAYGDDLYRAVPVEE